MTDGFDWESLRDEQDFPTAGRKLKAGSACPGCGERADVWLFPEIVWGLVPLLVVYGVSGAIAVCGTRWVFGPSGRRAEEGGRD